MTRVNGDYIPAIHACIHIITTMWKEQVCLDSPATVLGLAVTSYNLYAPGSKPVMSFSRLHRGSFVQLRVLLTSYFGLSRLTEGYEAEFSTGLVTYRGGCPPEESRPS